MNKDELKEYNNEIRRMLQHEDNIRNQRTSWFLVIQGFLINGILLVLTNKDFESKPDAITVLLIIGIIISFSFLYAAFISNKAYSQGKNHWRDIKKTYLETNNYPPVCLLEKKDSSQDQESQEEIKPKNIFLPYFFLPLFFIIIETILLIYTHKFISPLIFKILLIIITLLLLLVIIIIVLVNLYIYCHEKLTKHT